MTIIAGAFDCTGLTPPQLALVDTAIKRCRYDFTRCLPALRAQWGKSAIDVVFSDLSRFSAGARRAVGRMGLSGNTYVDERERAGDGHTHEGVHVDDPETGAVGHGVLSRHRVLGLAWSDGKIELDASLESQSELCQEVFLSEGWHQAEWFDPALDAAGMERLWDVFHDGTDNAGGHGHDFYDAGAYETWVGEAGMALFVLATSDVPVTLTQFVHKPTEEAIAVARELLDIEADVEVTVPTFFATKRGRVFHDDHSGIAAYWRYDTRALAVAAGLKPCGVCKP